MKTSKEMLQRAHDVAVEMKTHTWDHHGSNALMPHGWALFEKAGAVDMGLETAIQVRREMIDRVINSTSLPDQLMEDFRESDAPRAIASCLTFIMGGNHPEVQTGDRLLGVIIHVDAYMRQVDQEEEVKAVRKGDLHRDFETNPASAVREVLMTQVFESDLVGGMEHAVITQGYALDDGGRIRWDEPRYDRGRQQGDLVDAIRPFFPIEPMEVK